MITKANITIEEAYKLYERLNIKIEIAHGQFNEYLWLSKERD